MAEQAIAARLTPLPAETLPLTQCIGRTLREDVYAERDNPPFDRVCMDGIAIASAAFARGMRRFRIEAVQPAGAPALTLAVADDAVEVMTGAIMPRGTDCVVPLEEYEIADGAAALNADARGTAWRNVQRRGEDSRPDVPMLRAGARLGAPEIAVAASAGRARVRVSRQPRLVVVSTGDELVEPGEPIAEHQVRRSNAYAIVAALREHGLGDVVDDHLADDEALLRDRIGRHLAGCDALILSGGISKGKFDLVPKVLRELGVPEVFAQVAQRPGMPMWFGTAARGQLVFGLPGNPVSTLVCLTRYVLPALAATLSAPRTPPERVALAAEFPGRSMTYFLPVAVRHDERGCARAEPRPPRGSGDFLALAGTQGFVELPPRTEVFPAGFLAHLYRW